MISADSDRGAGVSGWPVNWRRVVDAAAKAAEEQGVEVLNCSPVSALRNYPKVDFAEALA